MAEQYIADERLSKFTPEYVSLTAYDLERQWSERTAHIQELYDVLELSNKNESPIFESIVDNEPAVMIKMAVHLLAQLPHRTSIKVDPTDESKVALAGKTERALPALWKHVDEHRHLSGKLKSQYAKMLLVTGWRHVRYWMPDNTEQTPLRVVVDSPLQAFPSFADEKLVQYVHRYTVTLKEAYRLAQQWGLVMPQSTMADTQKVTISDFYELMTSPTGEQYVVNCITWNNHEYTTNKPGSMANWIRAPYVMEGLVELPVICGPVGGHPDSARTNWTKMAGESFLDANLALYTKGDKWLSAYAQFAKEHAQQIMIWRDIEIPEKSDGSAEIRDRSGLDIEAHSSPTTQPDIKPVPVQSNTELITFLMQMMSGMKQRGSFPYITFGGLQQELSGFAITQLFKAIYYKLSDFLDTINMDFRRMEKDFLNWAKAHPKGVRFVLSADGGVAHEEVWDSKKDIPQGAFDLEVTQRLNTPDTLAQRIQVARMALPGNTPIIPFEDVWEKVLEFDDPSRGKEMVKANIVEFDPVESLVDKYKEYKLKEREYEAAGDEDSKQLAGIYAALASAIFSRLTGKPTGQTPQQNTEMGPSAMPPEAQGVSPDAARAAMGTNRGAQNAVR